MESATDKKVKCSKIFTQSATVETRKGQMQRNLHRVCNRQERVKCSEIFTESATVETRKGQMQ